jgi:NADH-quinone oxidoreductase subunit M
MMLAYLLIITFVSGLLSWLVSRLSVTACRLISLAGLIIDAVLLVFLWVNHYSQLLTSGNTWIAQVQISWITPFGISFHLAMDGLSLLLMALTILLGITSIVASWNEVKQCAGAFHFTLLAAITGIMGVFTSLDLFLFYFFWELMLVPMFFLISIWGHENKIYAAVKFFIFTQAGGLLMLVSIIALYFIHGHSTGNFTFDYSELVKTPYAGTFIIMLGFFIAFAVKLPVVPLHVWLPDAHTEAPTAGSVILAGLLLKTGAYGIIRFILPLFSAAAKILAPAAFVLAVIGIFYGALAAFAQKDLKRLVAYTSISHLGFVLLGIFAGNETALQGAVIIMLAHGLSTGALFIIIGALQQRIHTRDMTVMGGLWQTLPRMGGVTLFFALASLGLPGLANFIGEFLVLAGTFKVYPWVAAIAALGFIFSAVYSLWIIYRVFQGPLEHPWKVPDLRAFEMINLGIMMVGIVWIGIFPQTVIKTAKTALNRIQSTVKSTEKIKTIDEENNKLFLEPGIKNDDK